MYAQQITVSLENKTALMADITDLLAQHCINIRALAFTETDGSARLQIVVNDTEKTKEILNSQGFALTQDDVLVIEVPDRPGGLASVLATVKGVGAKINFLSAFSQRSGASGLIILHLPELEQAAQALDKAGVRILSSDDLFAL